MPRTKTALTVLAIVSSAILVFALGPSAGVASVADFKLPPGSCFIPLVDTRESQLVANSSSLNDYLGGLGVTPLHKDVQQYQAGKSVWSEAPVDALRKIVAAHRTTCKDFIVYLAGHGPADPEASTEGVVTLGTIGSQTGANGNTSLTASDLRTVVMDNTAATFKLIVESCNSGLFLDSTNPNWIPAQKHAVKTGKAAAPSLSNPPANLLEVTVSASRS